MRASDAEVKRSKLIALRDFDCARNGLSSLQYELGRKRNAGELIEESFGSFRRCTWRRIAPSPRLPAVFVLVSGVAGKTRVKGNPNGIISRSSGAHRPKPGCLCGADRKGRHRQA